MMIKITSTFSSPDTNFSPFDTSLVAIKQHLTERFAVAEGEEEHDLIIDIGMLGVHRESVNFAQRWGDKSVYPIRLYHNSVMLGPLYQPTETDSPCPLCLERRWFALRSVEEQGALSTSLDMLVSSHNPRLTPFALEAIGTMVTSVLSQSITADQSRHQVYTLNLDSLLWRRHPLIPDSLCPVCATPLPDTPEAAVIHLSSRPKPDTATYHLKKASEYGLPLDGFINPVCGVLGTSTMPDYKSSISAPVSGIFKLRNKYNYPFEVWWGGHSASYERSLQIGVLEGLERHAGYMARKKKSTVFDSYHNLSADALNPLDCGVYRPEFYHMHQKTHMSPFDPKQKMVWVWGYSFREARPILVPEQMVYYLDYRFEPPNFVQESSSGCALGSCLEEAILFGLLELIERDAFMLTWVTRLSLPQIDPQSLSQPDIGILVNSIDRFGYDLYLFDTRLDLSPPVVMAICLRREEGLGRFMLTAGSSLDPEDAIRGALVEAAAFLPTFQQRTESKLEKLRHMVQDYALVQDLHDHSLLYSLPEMAPQTEFLFQNQQISSVEECYGEWMAKRPQSCNLLDDLSFCLNEILDRGMDVVVVDQTSPEQERFGLKTACVIVPGLLPIDFGWGRDRTHSLPRLRTVPRTAGFMEKEFDPALNNLAPHPFP